MSKKSAARIGMVNFINTAPIYETWKSTVKQLDWQVVEANPVQLNKMLASGELDLGFISSQEYAASPEKYRILPDLSISANGPVGSVYLFSEFELSDLNNQEVFLSPQSQTSNSLVKIILEKFIGVKPRYKISKSISASEDSEKAVVAIGDRALRIKASGRYSQVLDLSEMWKEHTGLPFVFAVWAVRDSFFKNHHECVKSVHQELLRCATEGEKNLMSI